MKILPTFIESTKLVTVDVPGKLPKIPEHSIVRIRPSADATETDIEKAVAKAQKFGAASVRVMSKPTGSAVAQVTVAAVQVGSLRDICESLANGTHESIRALVVDEVEERLRSTGL
jgi:nucleoid-associated protein YgaU